MGQELEKLALSGTQNQILASLGNGKGVNGGVYLSTRELGSG